MTTSGWIVMILSISSVSFAFFWCIYKVLKTPGETDHLRGIDQHTPDQDSDQ